MAKDKRSGRQTLMDDMLDDVLATVVPEKDTGPDPTEIVSVSDTDETAGSLAADDMRSVTVQLDAADRELARVLLDLLRQARGETGDLADALRIALHGCPLDLQTIERARAKLGTRLHRVDEK